MLLTNAGHCTFPQPGRLVAHCMPRVSYSDDFSLSCSAGEWGHPLPRNFSSLYPQWESSPLSFPIHSWRSAPWKATKRSLPAMCSVLSLRVSPARNGLKPSGQQQKQRSWTSFHANDLSVASCASLCSCLPGPRGLQNLGLDFNSSSLICLTDCQPRTSPCLWWRP